jgi:hypothetical protein
MRKPAGVETATQPVKLLPPPPLQAPLVDSPWSVPGDKTPPPEAVSVVSGWPCPGISAPVKRMGST